MRGRARRLHRPGRPIGYVCRRAFLRRIASLFRRVSAPRPRGAAEMGGCAGEGVRRWRLAALTMTPARAAHTSGLRRTSPVAAVASFRSAAARIVFTEERSSVMCKLSLSRACVWDTLSLLVVTSETGDPCGHLCVVAAGRFFAPLRIFACWAASCAHSRMWAARRRRGLQLSVCRGSRGSRRYPA